tara:strand:+ start:231 stop:416 length:186 start_codon:yes stop_codon:yes gene_type:complete
MPEILITKMKVDKNKIEIFEAKIVDSNGNPTRNVSINESFAVALKGSIINLDLSHLKNEAE